MKDRNVKVRRISFINVWVCLIILFLVSCSSQITETGILSSAPTLPASPTITLRPAPKPAYIMDKTPRSVIKFEAYVQSLNSEGYLFRGIVVSIWGTKLGITEGDCNWETIQPRVALYINKTRVADDTLIGWRDGEPQGCLFRMSWAPELSPGLHEATFQFITDSGDVLEYSWQFVLEE